MGETRLKALRFSLAPYGISSCHSLTDPQSVSNLLSSSLNGWKGLNPPSPCPIFTNH